tara:strand:- start:930 stop:2345 length:1416 start_codon:yes stop_codon:yes gene_type:complete
MLLIILLPPSATPCHPLPRKVREARTAAENVEQLQKQLREAEESTAELLELRSCFGALGAQLSRWERMIDASIVTGASTTVQEVAAGAVFAPRSIMGAIEALLAQSNEQTASARALHCTAMSEGRQLREQLQVARQKGATLQTSLNETKAKLAAAEQLGLPVLLERSERISGKLKAEGEGLKRLLAAFEEDREALLKGSEEATAAASAPLQQQCLELQAQIGSLKAVQRMLEEKTTSLAESLAQSRHAEQITKAEVVAMAAARDDAMQKLTLALIERDAALTRHADGAIATPQSVKAAAKLTRGGEEAKRFKVLHMTKNPTLGATQATLESLRAKVRSLQLQLQAGSGPVKKKASESGASESPLAAAAALADASHIAALLELREANATLIKQKDRLASVFKNKIDEFRKAVMALTGYRVDLMDKGRYHLYHSYAPRAAVLSFRINKEGALHQVSKREACVVSAAISCSNGL